MQCPCSLYGKTGQMTWSKCHIQRPCVPALHPALSHTRGSKYETHTCLLWCTLGKDRYLILSLESEHSHQAQHKLNQMACWVETYLSSTPYIILAMSIVHYFVPVKDNPFRDLSMLHQKHPRTWVSMTLVLKVNQDQGECPTQLGSIQQLQSSLHLKRTPSPASSLDWQMSQECLAGAWAGGHLAQGLLPCILICRLQYSHISIFEAMP
jgi:hypothetical protein